MKVSRRNFLASAGIVSLGLVSGLKAAEEHKKALNVVYINIDDWGWTDCGFMGSSYYETPNIDKLASEGMYFTNAYTPAANCAPSRASVFSGQYTPRHGIYTVGTSERGESKYRKLIPTENNTVLSQDNETFASVFQRAGYATCHIGKWHISDDPAKHGFEVNIGGNHSASPKSYFSPYKNEDLPDGPKGEYITDRLTDEAVKYLKNHDRQKPFLLSIPHYAVHTPIQGKKDLIKKYESKIANANHFNPEYAAMVDSVDQSIGRILTTIDELGLRESTLILMTSDNGGVARFSHQSPLRSEKGAYYEGGLRVPLIVRWSGKINPKTRCDVPVCGIDFYPTFLEAAGLKPKAGKILDGVSLLPLFEGKQIAERPLFWHFPIYLEEHRPTVELRDPLFRTRPGSVVRLGKWKLHEYFEDGALELYNLNIDISERVNLAGRFPEKVKELHSMLKDWRKSINAPVPAQLNPMYDEKATAKAVQDYYNS